MDAYKLQKWKRIEELMEELKIKYILRTNIEIIDYKGLCLGHFETVDEVYAFICGYSYVKPYLFNKHIQNILHPKKKI
jgi:hypothetical protein